MPDHEDYKAIVEFVGHLPSEDFEDAFHPVWERYKFDKDEVTTMAAHFATEALQSAMRYSMDPRARQEVIEATGDPNPDNNQIFVWSVQAALLQMLCIGSEFSRRWVLPEMLAGSMEALDKILEAPDATQ